VSDPFKDMKSASVLAQAIVDTVREPLLFGRVIYDLIDGQFNIPSLRILLGKIAPDHATMDGFEIETMFPGIGKRTYLLNAREVFYEGNGHKTLLLGACLCNHQVSLA
jgi:hypothetical protein